MVQTSLEVLVRLAAIATLHGPLESHTVTGATGDIGQDYNVAGLGKDGRMARQLPLV